MLVCAALPLDSLKRDRCHFVLTIGTGTHTVVSTDASCNHTVVMIGIAIDAISGGVYKLTPEEVAGSLPARNASIDKNKDGIYVVVVLQPKPEWVKVAQLQR